MFESLATPPCSTHILRPHSRGHHAEELNWVVLNWKKIFIEATSSLDVPTPLSHSGSSSISPRCSDLSPVHPLTWCDKLCLGSRFIPLVPLDFHDAAVKVDAINAAVQGLYKTHTHTHLVKHSHKSPCTSSLPDQVNKHACYFLFCGKKQNVYHSLYGASQQCITCFIWSDTQLCWKSI